MASGNEALNRGAPDRDAPDRDGLDRNPSDPARASASPTSSLHAHVAGDPAAAANPRTGVRPDLRPDGAVPRRWGPASWFRLGLVALLALIVGLAIAGGAFWTAAPVDAPR